MRRFLSLGCRVTVLALGLTGWLAAQAMPSGITFDISAGAASTSLKEFATQAHLQLLFDYKAVEKLRTPAVKGQLTPTEALKEMLQGSGFTFHEINDHTIAITRPGASTSSTGMQQETPSGTEPAKEGKPNFSAGSLLAQVAQAQTSSSATAESKNPAGAENSTGSLQEVIVTAQKRAERLQDVPISISVLGGQELDRSTFQGVTEALRSVPGVSTIEALTSGGTTITMRGVAAGGPILTGSSPIAYYLDSAPFGFVNSAILPDANVYDLERVEVLRGPQGTLYGANAENGLVRVLTNDADVNSFELKARGLGSTTDGGGGNYAGDVAVNVPIVEGKLALRGVVDYQNLSGWIDNPTLGIDHVNTAEMRNYRLKLNADPTDALSIGMSLWSTRNDFGGPSISNDARERFSEFHEPIETNYDDYALKVAYNFSNFSISSATSYLSYFNLGTIGTNVTPTFVVSTVSQFTSHVFAEELILNSAPQASWHWTAGAFYRDGTDRLLQAVPGVLPLPFDLGNGSKSIAGFGQIGRRFIDDKFEWTLGVRYFHDDVFSRENAKGPFEPPTTSLIYEADTFNATTPRAVLMWYPTSEWTVYSSYSQGFRSGFPQDAAVLAAAPSVPPAKPDKLHNYEIGAKADLLAHRLSLDTAVYYIKWKDIQQNLEVPLPDGVCCVSALTNGQSASGPGVDFALTARPLDGLELSISAGWNDLTMDADVISNGQKLFLKGDRLNYSPEFTGGASADYIFPVGGGYSGRFSASGNYISKQVQHYLGTTAPIVSEGTSLLNVRLSLAVIAPAHWSAELFVDNLTNDYPAFPVFGTPDPPYYDSVPRVRPRTMGVQVTYSYR